MKRKLAFALVLSMLVPALAHGAEVIIKLGTLAPKSSPWGKVLETWVKAVNEKSGGRLELQVFYNGAQGDDDAMVGKLKSGQLDGALITTAGLSKVYKPITALSMWGLFSSWAKLDKARDAMKAEFEKGAKDAGFHVAGWCDVGIARVFSKGFAVQVPDDLKGKKPVYIRADALGPAVYSVIGGVSGVPLNVPEVLPNLNTGAVNVVVAPSLTAEQLQWASKLDHVQDQVTATAIGALVLSSKRLDALPADLKTILTDTGKVASAALTTRIRAEDDAAFARLKKKMTVVTLSDDARSRWTAIFKQARQKLAQGTFSSDLVTKLEGYAK
ncbi:MAG: TRAP transporter substrate-binding protein DctP [Deltaproteobacteria bacterium]|nr:TRAP transporter substrate-binding protein DctP [Deltaproteobacteria bacterium]